MVFLYRKPKRKQRDSYAEFDTINNNMNHTPNSKPDQPQPQPVSQPNERTGLNIDEHVKIWDPNTQNVILEKRA